MTFGKFSFSRKKLALLDCKEGKRVTLSQFPAWIGGKGAEFQVDETDKALAEFDMDGDSPVLKIFGSQKATINGLPRNGALPLVSGEDLAILIDKYLILACWTKDPDAWFAQRAQDSWRVVTQESEVLAGPASLTALEQKVAEIFQEHPKAILHQVSCGSGFFLEEAAVVLGWDLAAANRPKLEKTSSLFSSPALQKKEDPAEEQFDINTDSGQFTCPVCWIRFDRGDVLHVANHESLKGDPILGEEHMLRFTATRFNNTGQALDAMGIPAAETACPHCRRALPPSFLDLRQHIVSIVGAPSSGKSYFLSVLIKTLQNKLYTKFQSAFYDADPKENVRLTEMKNKLFSAASPEEASIAKTDLESDMYLMVSRMGRKVYMPRPFIFSVAPPAEVSEPVALVFYDNAGEHFEPTRDSASSPGAQHVAAASGILFLFDPTYNLEFRRRLNPEKDPQLSDERFDQQDTLLAEMNSRIKKLRGIDFRQKIETPLAIVVGKLDVWGDLLPAGSLADPLEGDSLNLQRIQQNSDIVRDMLYKVVPSIVANAESISSNVRYFPVSAFGCSPEEIAKDPKTGRRRFSPDPHKIRPQFVEIPMVWLLSQLEPEIIKVSQGE
jgi:hypothetical protein